MFDKILAYSSLFVLGGFLIFAMAGLIFPQTEIEISGNLAVLVIANYLFNFLPYIRRKK